jgi:nitrile hydratase
MTDDDIREILAFEQTPTEDGDPVFEAAWQARVFGLSVSMRGEDGVFEWESFQRRLADEIASEDESAPPEDIEAGYYRHWLSAFERLLIENGHVDPAQLEERAAEFANGDRTAAEFVEGEHESDHDHGHDH